MNVPNNIKNIIDEETSKYNFGCILITPNYSYVNVKVFNETLNSVEIVNEMKNKLSLITELSDRSDGLSVEKWFPLESLGKNILYKMTFRQVVTDSFLIFLDMEKKERSNKEKKDVFQIPKPKSSEEFDHDKKFYFGHGSRSSSVFVRIYRLLKK